MAGDGGMKAAGAESLGPLTSYSIQRSSIMKALYGVPISEGFFQSNHCKQTKARDDFFQ